MTIDPNTLAQAVRQEDLGQLNELLYEAARGVLGRWETGDLAEAVRDLQAVCDALDKLEERLALVDRSAVTDGSSSVAIHEASGDWGD